MTELKILRGYPGSGKTTWARRWVGEAYQRARVSRDDLRQQLFAGEGVLSSMGELAVTKAEQGMVRALLEAGTSVVVDDMNLTLRYARAWADLAQELGVEFSVEDIKTPVDTCVANDMDRVRLVGADVIRGIAKRFPFKQWPEVKPTQPLVAARQYVPKEGTYAAWIVDIDGTLADHHGVRDAYDSSLYHLDKPHRHIVDLVQTLMGAEKEIIIVSGRSVEFQAQTEAWLRGYDIPYTSLFMRSAEEAKNKVRDDIVKERLFWEKIAPYWKVEAVLDDRDRVVKMWRSIGLPCLQVAPGPF